MRLIKVDFKDVNLIQSINNFLNLISSVDVKQTPEWFIAREECGFAICFAEDKGIIGYCNVFINENEAYLPRGPVTVANMFDVCLDSLCDYIKSLGYSKMRLNPKIQEKLKTDRNINCCDKNDFSKLRESYREAIVELKNKSENDLLYEFSSSTRYHIRKALNNNLIINLSEICDLDDFYSIYEETAIRHNFIPHNKQYFENLIKAFKEKIYFCKISYNNEVVAMSLNILQGDTVHYLYGASSSQNNKLYAAYLMHWVMIKYALNNGFKFYNFGGVFAKDNEVDSKDYGLLRFKSGFCKGGFIEYEPDMIILL